MGKIDWEYWMGWIVAWVISALALIATGLHMFFQHNICTGDASEQCAREWISATGGWAAIPAAALTIFFLSKQISRADRHHRQNIMLQSEHKYEVARTLAALSEEADLNIQRVLRTAELGNIEQLRKDLKKLLLNLFDHYDDADAFDDFEKLFLFAGPYRVTDIRSALRKAKDASPITSIVQFDESWTKTVLGMARAYNRSVAAACEGYMERIDKLMD